MKMGADEDGIDALSPRIRLLIEDLRTEWRALDVLRSLTKSLSKWRGMKSLCDAW
jgi:hypothetical protein